MLKFKSLRHGGPIHIRDWADISGVEALHNDKGEVTGSQIVVEGVGYQVTALPDDIADEKGDEPAPKKAKKD